MMPGEGINPRKDFMKKMKILAVLALASTFGLLAQADQFTIDTQATRIIRAVYGEGLAPIPYDSRGIPTGEGVDAAKQLAEKNAEAQCGGPVEVAENLGWEIHDTDYQPPCQPHRFCASHPTKVHAKAIFVCTGKQ
jgi:hypothetical protein